MAMCGMNIVIKKRSTVLVFHRTREVNASGEIELQHITNNKNWSNFLTKAADNVKFMAYTKALDVN